MTKKLLEKLLTSGESYTIEYKKCINKLSESVYETVCSFSNRYGGYILLGVEEVDYKGYKRGVVVGVNKDKIYDMKRNFVTSLNNNNKIMPSMYLNLEEFEYDGKVILWVYVPESSQLCFCNGRVFDRNDDADQDITASPIALGDVARRKSTEYFERKVLPYADKSDLKLELLDNVRRLVIGRSVNHPWRDMDDMELMRSAGLYEKDIVTGDEGFNVAAILLFGKPEVIQSVAPGYKTDAIYRIENVDRYDDRIIVQDNLLEAYDKLIGFIEKHTDDRFTLDGNLSVSSRDYIAREVVSNILIHRDFSSAFPAKLIIEKDVLRTENWSKSKYHGKLNLNDFSPYPKNPLLANFFVNIARADTLGSGMRNLYKYSKMYSGNEPVLIEGDVFRIEIPLNNNWNRIDSDKTFSLREGQNYRVNKKVSDKKQAIKTSDKKQAIKTSDKINKIILFLEDKHEAKTADIAEYIGLSPVRTRAILSDMDEVIAIGSNKNRKYRLK